MRHNRQLRRLGAALIFLVVIFGLITATARERTAVTGVEKFIATLLYPLQVGTDWVAGRFRGIGESVRELTHLREENARLRSEIQAASQASARNQMLEQENLELRTEMQMKARAKLPLLSAEVISRTSDNWYRTVVINRGSRDGVQTNMPVVNWQGLVGKVSHTTPFTATVQLVIDSGFGQGGFGAGAKLPSQELGVLETVQGGYIRMKFWNREPAVQVGQPVFTSGQGILPPDLLIGYVDGLGTAESTFEKTVSVRPAVDFHKLDVVHVVIYTPDKDKGVTAP